MDSSSDLRNTLDEAMGAAMSPGRLLAIVYIAVGLSIGLMKIHLPPPVCDFIGPSCLVLVGLSLLAVFLIFCASPYTQCCNSPSNKIEIVSSSTPKMENEPRSDNNHQSLTDEASIADSESVTVDIQHIAEQSQMKTSQPILPSIFSVGIDMEITELRRL
uniref:Uncharacterized protein n=1 Tax=Daphnia galeata TaxID=27404 RepID=A0A8J2WPI0_9CRUS|nr:unnamed protein product [Daphnia galeata]